VWRCALLALSTAHARTVCPRVIVLCPIFMSNAPKVPQPFPMHTQLFQLVCVHSPFTMNGLRQVFMTPRVAGKLEKPTFARRWARQIVIGVSAVIVVLQLFLFRSALNGDPSAGAPAFCSPPVLSVITAVYNANCSQLQETADNIKMWTVPVQWVVINDHSSQPLCPCVHESGVRLLHNQYVRGLGPARQYGIDRVTTKYWMLLDGDDMYKPSAVEKALWVMETQPYISMVSFHLQEFGWSQGQWHAGFHDRVDMIHHNRIAVAAMVRRAAAVECGARFSTDLRGGLEDWDFWLQMLACGKHGHTIRTPEFLYRTRDPAERAKLWSTLTNTAQVEQAIRSQYPELVYGSWPATPYPPKWSADRLSTNSAIRAAPPALFRGMVSPANCHAGELTQATPSRRPCSVVLFQSHMEYRHQDWTGLQLLNSMRELGPCSVSVVTSTHRRSESEYLRASFDELTGDIQVMPLFVSARDSLSFIVHILRSRRATHMVVNGQVLAAQLLPYIRKFVPEVAIVVTVLDPQEDLVPLAAYMVSSYAWDVALVEPSQREAFANTAAEVVSLQAGEVDQAVAAVLKVTARPSPVHHQPVDPSYSGVEVGHTSVGLLTAGEIDDVRSAISLALDSSPAKYATQWTDFEASAPDCPNPSAATGCSLLDEGRVAWENALRCRRVCAGGPKFDLSFRFLANFHFCGAWCLFRFPEGKDRALPFEGWAFTGSCWFRFDESAPHDHMCRQWHKAWFGADNYQVSALRPNF